MRMLLRIPHSSASIKVNLENETQYLDEFKLKYKLKVKRSSYWNSICADAKHNTLKPMTIESRLPSWLDCSIFFFSGPVNQLIVNRNDKSQLFAPDFCSLRGLFFSIEKACLYTQKNTQILWRFLFSLKPTTMLQLENRIKIDNWPRK